MGLFGCSFVSLLWLIQANALEPQDPDRPQISADYVRALREHNIFSPDKTKRRFETKKGEEIFGPPEPRTTNEPLPKAKPKPPVVTGLLMDGPSETYQALVEDKNTESMRLMKEPKLLKAGDELLGFKVDSVSKTCLVISHADKTHEIKVGGAFPEEGLKIPEGWRPSFSSSSNGSSSTTSEKTESKPIDDSTRSVLERLRLERNKKRDYEKP